MLWPRACGPTNKALEVVQFVWDRQRTPAGLSEPFACIRISEVTLVGIFSLEILCPIEALQA